MGSEKTGRYSERAPSDWKKLPRPLKNSPQCIYFYYITEKENSDGFDVQMYFKWVGAKITEDDLADYAIELTLNARGSQDDPPLIGRSYNARPWERISWIVNVIDTPQHPIVASEPVFIEYLNESQKTQNHTFFDGNYKRFSIPGHRDVDLVYFRNHMRKPNGNLIEIGETETFEFHFNHGQPRFYPDNSGTNSGPPIPP